MKKLLFASLWAAMLFVACTTEEDPIFNNVITGEITTPTTWTANKTWVIDGTIYVLSDLVIEPGTVIKFNPGTSLIIGSGEYGSLMAIGTPEKPILFTSNATSPSVGDYYGIAFNSFAAKTSSLAFCTIEYAGHVDVNNDAALNLNQATVSIVSCTIKKSEGHGISNYYGDFSLFSLNTIKECADYPLDIPASCAHKLDVLSVISGKGVYINDAGLFGQTVTWNKLTVPYILNGLEIYDDGVLTIAPGTKLHFLAGGSVDVGSGSFGKLVAIGTFAEPIEFSSAAPSPSKGDWNGLRFWDSASSGSIISFCTVSYGGCDPFRSSNIYSQNNGSNLTISNSTISYSEGCGIYTSGCTPDISDIVYVDNTNNECGDLVPAN